MNILIDMPPETVMVDGGIFRINSDFANILQIFEVFESDLSSEEKQIATLCLFYDEVVPDNVEFAFKELIKFIKRGKENNKTDKNEPVIDFIKDGDYIFSAFYQTYKIDLTEINLHWWKFLALLDSISSDTLLARIKEIRGADLNEITDKKQREKLRKAKAVVAISKPKTNDSEKREQAMALYYKGR